MLTEIEKATALKIVLASDDPEEFGVVNDRLCQEFPNIQTDDLIALWREAGERQISEAEELEKFARMRRAQRRPVTPCRTVTYTSWLNRNVP